MEFAQKTGNLFTPVIPSGQGRLLIALILIILTSAPALAPIFGIFHSIDKAKKEQKEKHKQEREKQTEHEKTSKGKVDKAVQESNRRLWLEKD